MDNHRSPPTPVTWTLPDRTLLVWAAVVLFAPIVVVALPGRLLPIPEPHRISVESRMLDTVMLDIRSADARGGVIGPPLRRLAPGDTVDFTATPGAPVCVRLVTLEELRVVPIGLPRLRAARETRLTVTAGLLSGSSSAAPCDPRLADHRVRLSWARYFEPGSPDDVRRGRLLRGR